jgi:hypothetical protein
MAQRFHAFFDPQQMRPLSGLPDSGLIYRNMF